VVVLVSAFPAGAARVPRQAESKVDEACLCWTASDKIRNPKHEIRNKFEIQNPNAQTKGTTQLRVFFFRPLDLFRISDFGFRVSEFPLTCKQRAVGPLEVNKTVPLCNAKSSPFHKFSLAPGSIARQKVSIRRHWEAHCCKTTGKSLRRSSEGQPDSQASRGSIPILIERAFEGKGFFSELLEFFG
jgi:hypothetical protein